MSKLICAHVDICLPDYWSGHHLAHISVPVYNGMKLGELKSVLHSELNEGAVAGNNPLTMDGSGEDGDKWYKKAHAAVNRITLVNPKKRKLFTELDVQTEDDYCDSVYAYFVFIESEI